jgi:hypothetical protein
LNKIDKWQVFWLNVYFDLPIRECGEQWCERSYLVFLFTKKTGHFTATGIAPELNRIPILIPLLMREPITLQM